MNEKKLKFSEKLSYGISDFPEVVNSILTAFLTMFYTDSIGMAAGAVGTMFFLSKLFDGITDEIQSAATNTGIITLFAWIPAVLLVVIFFILKYVYKYDEIAETVVNTLNERRNK